jgi:hypothetical protein
LIAVLGSELDEAARGLVDAWAAEGAVLLSAQDLCTRGWVFRAITNGDGWFVAGGVRRPTAALRGVVVRRPAVAAEELPWIAADDRQYVAAEINAFLVAWLSTLPCPVLSRPTVTSLWPVVADLLEGRGALASPGRIQSNRPPAKELSSAAHYGAANKRQQHISNRLSTVSGANLLGVFAEDTVAAVRCSRDWQSWGRTSCSRSSGAVVAA